MLNFVLCDDNSFFLNGLESMLNKLFIKHNLDAKIIFKTDSASTLLTYIKNNSVDVLFLDITLRNQNSGLNIAEEIRKINKNLRLVFTTGHFEFVMEAYKVNTFDYLVKPISYDKLEETLLRLIDYLNNSNSNFIKINGTTFINEDDVQYIQRDGMKLIYHTKDADYASYNSFSKVQDSLSSNFIRCHKSFIVNLSNISHIEIKTNTIYFHNHTKCYIGPKYKANFMEVINYGHSSFLVNSIDNTQ